MVESNQVYFVRSVCEHNLCSISLFCLFILPAHYISEGEVGLFAELNVFHSCNYLLVICSLRLYIQNIKGYQLIKRDASLLVKLPRQ